LLMGLFTRLCRAPDAGHDGRLDAPNQAAALQKRRNFLRIRDLPKPR
jgi:hypothetical protein